jgi:multidrug efflux pump subunit AcrB
MKRIIEYFAVRGVLVNLLTIFVVGVGLISLFQVQREAFPNVDFDIVLVQTIYPGASAGQMERLITSPLEQDLRSVTGIKKMISVSAESRSLITLELDTRQANADKIKTDIQDIVNRSQDIPAEAERPIVTLLESGQFPVIQISLLGDVSEEEMRRTAKLLERELELIPDVSQVNFNGLREREVLVETSPARLKRYQLTILELIEAIRARNTTIPAGALEARDPLRDSEYIIRTVGEYENADEVGETVIRANPLGQAIRVRDVATVTLGLERPSILFRTEGRRSVNLSVLQKAGADTISVVDQIKAKMDELRPNISTGIEIRYLDDISYYIRRRLGVLTNNLTVGLVLVMIILSMALPWRVALVAAAGLPFAAFGIILAFDLINVSVNLISLIGLIIIVGMLVDDAIVVTENAQRHMEEGDSPEVSAINGASEVAAPVFASVFTTILAFAPLLFMTGIFGKVAQFIPIGVIVGLVFSLIECFFILPHHVARWVKPKSAHEQNRKSRFMQIWDGKVVPLYMGFLEKVLRLRYVVALSVLAFIAATTILVTRFMDVILFPPGGIEAFIVNYEAPIGASLERTSLLAKPIEDEVAKLPKSELDSYITIIGSQGQSLEDPGAKRGTQFGQTIVYLTPATARDRDAFEIVDALREKLGTPEGLKQIRFEQVAGGPPVGKPVSIGVRGADYGKMLEAVKDIESRLADIEGIKDVTNSYNLGKKEVQIRINDVDASASGLTMPEIGTVVRASFEGVIASSIRQLDEAIGIRVSMAESQRTERETLEALTIPDRMGNLIPLRGVARFEDSQGIASYEHEAGRRQIRVEAAVDTATISSFQANRLIRQQVPEILKKHPEVSIQFGGEERDTQESLQSLIRAFAIAVFGIVLLLVLMFQSIRQTIVVALTIPLGVLSVAWTFFLHGRPLSFLGMIGIVALAGIVVNNAIVLTDFVNTARKRGLDRFESIRSAARTRLRPIALTTLTTSAGILPTAYGIGGLDPFVVPIALALGWGVFFGALLTVIVLPAALAIADDLTLWLARSRDRFRRSAR